MTSEKMAAPTAMVGDTEAWFCTWITMTQGPIIIAPMTSARWPALNSGESAERGSNRSRIDGSMAATPVKPKAQMKRMLTVGRPISCPAMATMVEHRWAPNR